MKVIKTDKLIEFCGGCNNSIVLKKFIQVDENQLFERAWLDRYENEEDELHRRIRIIGFCLCGNIYLLK